MQEELGFPDKADKRAQPGTVTCWTPAELNRILHDHVVAGELSTFGCVEWEFAPTPHQPHGVMEDHGGEGMLMFPAPSALSVGARVAASTKPLVTAPDGTSRCR